MPSRAAVCDGTCDSDSFITCNEIWVRWRTVTSDS